MGCKKIGNTRMYMVLNMHDDIKMQNIRERGRGKLVREVSVIKCV